MTNVMPKFNFAITVDDKAVEAAAAERGNKGDLLQSGRQKLVILKAEYKKPSDKDNTWLNFSLVVGKEGTKPGDDGKFKGVTYKNVMVPTQNILFDGKLQVFSMLQSFMAGVGVALSASNTAEVVLKYFSDPQGLVGMVLDVDLGYDGAHIAREKDLFYVLDKAKRRLPLSTDNEFTSRDAALGQAIVDGFTIKKYVDIVRIHPGELQEPAKAKKTFKAKVTTFEE